jgi:hypothetical protein
MGSPAMPHVTPIVFVVDDDISVCESLESLIRCEGWQSETFASAQEFLDRPRVLIPNCLVLDVSLPGLNGLDLQGLVAGEPTDMPIIFVKSLLYDGWDGFRLCHLGELAVEGVFFLGWRQLLAELRALSVIEGVGDTLVQLFYSPRFWPNRNGSRCSLIGLRKRFLLRRTTPCLNF